MLGWLRRARAWNREHVAAWAGMTEVGDDGHSRFQRECREAFERACEVAGQPAPRPERVDDGDPYLTGTLADGRPYFIYTDGAEVGDRRMEEWDFRTPAELHAAFVDVVLHPPPPAPAR